MVLDVWVRVCCSVIAGISLFGWASVAQAQDTGSARDVQTSCMVSDIPEFEQLSVTWTGDCAGGLATGVGSVFAFSRGELQYMLRGQFTNGRLSRRDLLRSCRGDECNDQIPAAVLRAHASAAGQGRAAPAPAQSAVATPPAPVSQVAGQTEIRSTDAVYRGSFVSDRQTGVLSGEGRVEFFDGRLFIGRLENGLKVGTGTYVWADGQRYVGGWRDDKQDGTGEWTSPQGERYAGQFHLSKREGKGVMTYASKMVYDGDWLADLPSGSGTFRFPNGDVYEGQVLAGEQTGTGTLTHQNGDRYTGQWLRGERHGRGLAEWKNQQRYEGEWQRDRKEGRGRMRFPDGGSYDGQWHDDKPMGQGSMTFAEGSSYVGDVLDGQPHGKGLYVWGSGDKFEGEFNAGKPTANGVMTFRIEPAASATTVNETVAAPEPPASAAASGPAGATALARATLCSRGYNSARNVSALRRFMEAFPDDECGRHALARQKIAAIEESERKIAREQEDRAAQAKALVGLVVAYRQDYPFCVSGSGSTCQRVVYQFEVKGQIRSVDLARQAVQLQVVDVALVGSEKGAPAQLVAEGRLAASEAFRSSMAGTTQWKTKMDVGLAF